MLFKPNSIRERGVRTRTTPAEGAASKPYENLLTLERGLGRWVKGQKPKVVNQIWGSRASPWAGRRPTVQIPRARPFPNSNTTIQRRFLTYFSGVVHTWFSGRPRIVDLCSCGGPGGPETPFTRWGAKRPTFPKGFAGRRGRQDPKNQRCSVGPKTMHQKHECGDDQTWKLTSKF